MTGINIGQSCPKKYLRIVLLVEIKEEMYDRTV